MAAVFLACLAFMFVWGLLAAMGTGSLPESSIIYRTLYYTFSESAFTVAVLTAISVVAGAGWLMLLSSFARPIIYVTAISIPSSIFVVSTVTFFVSMSSSYTPKTPDTLPEIRAVMGVSLAGIISALWVAAYIWRKRHMVDTMTHIIELSCDVLQLNSSLFVLSVGLMIAHAVFSVVWLVLFSRLFLVGSIEIDPGSGGVPGKPRLVPSGQTPYIAIFFVLMYFWTSAIFQNLEKTTIASVVGGWYFQDLPDSPTHRNDQTWRNFKFVATRSFGTVAFASLILGIARTLQWIISKVKSRTSTGTSFLRFLHSVMTAVSHLIDDFSSYTLVNTGLTGNSFTEAAYTCTRLFRRNLVLGLITQGMTRVISVMGKVLVSAIVGLVVFWAAVDRTSTGVGTGGHEWVAAGVATVVPYYVVGVLTHVIENTVDATFICYLVDLDTNSCHCEGAHRIFSESLS
ncbi:plasma-membrane choline transporter-domain-containing protein [Entophlyctis helioformis]|nr:plasma-membrane choline transporter-domain-containing protein [Entophlyctis helioformis]